MNTWTNPYHGVSHLNGLKPGFQVTAIERGSFTECWIIVPGSGFTTAKEMIAASLNEAKRWGKRVATQYGAARSLNSDLLHNKRDGEPKWTSRQRHPRHGPR